MRIWGPIPCLSYLLPPLPSTLCDLPGMRVRTQTHRPGPPFLCRSRQFGMTEEAALISGFVPLHLSRSPVSFLEFSYRGHLHADMPEERLQSPKGLRTVLGPQGLSLWAPPSLPRVPPPLEEEFSSPPLQTSCSDLVRIPERPSCLSYERPVGRCRHIHTVSEGPLFSVRIKTSLGGSITLLLLPLPTCW